MFIQPHQHQRRSPTSAYSGGQGAGPDEMSQPSVAWQDGAEAEPDDLAAPRGIARGVSISLGLWLGILLVLWLIFH